MEATEEYQAGFEAGQTWAKGTAKPKELRRVAEYIDTTEREAGGSYSWRDVDYPGWMAPFGATGSFVFAVWPQRNEGRDATDEFWEKALGDAKHRIEDADFFHGSGNGAADIWEKVGDKIDV